MARENLYYLLHTDLFEAGLPAFYTGSLKASGEPMLTSVKAEAEQYTRAQAESVLDSDLDANMPIANSVATVWDIVPANLHAV